MNGCERRESGCCNDFERFGEIFFSFFGTRYCRGIWNNKRMMAGIIEEREGWMEGGREREDNDKREKKNQNFYDNLIIDIYNRTLILLIRVKKGQKWGGGDVYRDSC